MDDGLLSEGDQCLSHVSRLLLDGLVLRRLSGEELRPVGVKKVQCHCSLHCVSTTSQVYLYLLVPNLLSYMQQTCIAVLDVPGRTCVEQA